MTKATGETQTYGEIAQGISAPNSARAVGASGDSTGYRWRIDRKKALLELEQF